MQRVTVKDGVRGTAAISVVVFLDTVSQVRVDCSRQSQRGRRAVADGVVLRRNNPKTNATSFSHRQSHFAASRQFPTASLAHVSSIQTRRPTTDESYSHSAASQCRRRPPNMNIHQSERRHDGRPANLPGVVAATSPSASSSASSSF